MKRIILQIIIGVFAFSYGSAQTSLLLQKADSLYKLKDFISSIKFYNKAIKKSSNDEIKYIYYQLGECYRSVNNFPQSKSWYEKAIDSGYPDPIINLHLGELLIYMGSYSDAKSYIDKYLINEPNNEIAKLKLESCNLGLKGQREKPLYDVKINYVLNSTFSEYGISYFKNNKLIFASSRLENSNKFDPATLQGYSDIYESSFNSLQNEWSKPVKLNGSVNTNFNDGTFSFDPISNIGYYTQCNGSNGKSEQCNIMYASYNETNNTWESSKLFEYNSNTFRIQQPAISKDGKNLYFSSDMPGGYGGADIYVIKKAGNVWGQPENLGSTINTIGDEMFPFSSGDSLLLFASDGLPGFGGLDIFSSKIQNGKYLKPINLMPPFNSSADDFNLIYKITKDSGFFCSNRIGGVGEDDIYEYYKIPVILSCSGNVRDKTTNELLENAVIYFKSNEGKIDSITTDNKGHFEFNYLKSKTDYSIKATDKGYLNDSKSLTISDEKYSKEYNSSKGNDLDFYLIKITKEEVKIDNIYYDYGKWDLRSESMKELDKIINVLKETPEVKIQISAHTDERGPKDFNEELSQKRAQSVVDYFISGGIGSDRLISKGYGSSSPVYKNAQTEDQHQLNRRTTFKIVNANDLKNIQSAGIYTPVVSQTALVSKKESEIINDVANNVNATSSNNTVATTTTNNTDKSNIVVASNNENLSSTTISENNVKSESTITSSSSNSNSEKKYFIIAGSYKNLTEANSAVSILKTKGFSNADVVGKNDAGNWRICYNSYYSKEEAQKDLPGIKQSYNPSAWIFGK